MRRREEEESSHAERSEAARAKETAEISAKIAAAKERRLMDARNRATKQLGDADEDEDDLGAWVNKSRTIEAKRREAERAKAEALARLLAEQDDDAERNGGSDGGGGARRARRRKELAGLKVRHGADEVNEGETMILTLKDSSILDEKRGALNEEEDELERTSPPRTAAREGEEGGVQKTRKFEPVRGGRRGRRGRRDGAGEVRRREGGRGPDAGRPGRGDGGGGAAQGGDSAAAGGDAGGGARGRGGGERGDDEAEPRGFHDRGRGRGGEGEGRGVQEEEEAAEEAREKALDPSELEGDELAPGASELGKRRGAGERGRRPRRSATPTARRRTRSSPPR